MPSTQDTLTQREAAAYCRISAATLARMRQDARCEAQLPGPAYVRIGRRIIYRKQDLEAWLAQLAERSRPPIAPERPTRGRKGGGARTSSVGG